MNEDIKEAIKEVNASVDRLLKGQRVQRIKDWLKVQASKPVSNGVAILVAMLIIIID